PTYSSGHPFQAMENPVEEPMSRLTRDLIAEILSRVPYKSLCICKCVCPAWRDLIADPVYRKKIVHSLTGFFYRITEEAAAFPGVNYAYLSAFPWASVPKTHPRLPLPPDSTDRVMSVDDSCDGLFLARISIGAGNFRYMVSNPATGEYTLLPHNGHAGNDSIAYLGFDSDASTEGFHVFEFAEDWSPPDHRGIQFQVVTQVRIYSSKTDVFGLAIVDAQGLKWRIVPLPANSFSGFIGKSHGHLFYVDSDTSLTTISVYTLSGEIYNWGVCHQDDDCIYWKLYKCSNVIPNKESLEVIGVHPHANLIFIAHSNNQVLAYDLDRQESTVVCHLGHTYHRFMQFFPYVPLLSCLPLDGGIRLVTPS
uniref:F-box domain-containing protein n=2 Tax=Aegilops tauschii subsp. strangulata TaxID=200361 RepID=A0A453T1B1_AEGTS